MGIPYVCRSREDERQFRHTPPIQHLPQRKPPHLAAAGEGIIHAVRLPVDSITHALDDPSVERQMTQLQERSRSARMLVIDALKQHNLTPDRNVLLTAGLREELMQLHTEQLLWEIVVSGEGEAVERRVVPLE